MPYKNHKIIRDHVHQVDEDDLYALKEELIGVAEDILQEILDLRKRVDALEKWRNTTAWRTNKMSEAMDELSPNWREFNDTL